ncbi:hypothetical protein F4678DRAFT_317892 [Xylaria arbuscula]|nr:hypothetical protein F4678DRAFT_317892 [Xylaria arbuscula]
MPSKMRSIGMALGLKFFLGCPESLLHAGLGLGKYCMVAVIGPALPQESCRAKVLPTSFLIWTSWLVPSFISATFLPSCLIACPWPTCKPSELSLAKEAGLPRILKSSRSKFCL